MLGEARAALLSGIFLDINSLVILLMTMCFVAHEFTSYWDLAYAAPRRRVSLNWP